MLVHASALTSQTKKSHFNISVTDEAKCLTVCLQQVVTLYYFYTELLLFFPALNGTENPLKWPTAHWSLPVVVKQPNVEKSNDSGKDQDQSGWQRNLFTVTVMLPELLVGLGTELLILFWNRPNWFDPVERWKSFGIKFWYIQSKSWCLWSNKTEGSLFVFVTLTPYLHQRSAQITLN